MNSVSQCTSLLTASRSARCCLLDDDNFALLFVAESQQVLRVHGVVARLWPGLERGLWNHDMVETLEYEGVVGQEVLDHLIDVGAVHEIPVSGRPGADASKLFLRVGNCRVLLIFDSPVTRKLVEPAFAHLSTEESRFDVSFSVALTDGRYAISIDGGAPDYFSEDSVSPGLKTILTETVFEYTELLVMHAATLVRDDRALLIFGPPGAGKSTLSLFASGTGPFDLAGDDISELMPGGKVRGLPFSGVVKSGSVDLLRPVFPSLEQIREFVRPDKKRVRYLPPPFTDRILHGVGWIVVLDRQDSNVTAKLEPVGFVEALQLSIEGAWSEDTRVSPPSFDSLVAMVGGARCFRLNYSDLSDATRLLAEITEPSRDFSQTIVEENGCEI